MVSSVQQILFILFAFIVSLSQFYSYAPVSQVLTCITPENVLGYCVPMGYCQRINSILRTWQGQPFQPFVADYIQRTHCATIGYVHYGCCASHEITNINPYNYPNYDLWNTNQNTAPTQVASLSYAENVLNSMPCGSCSRQRISNGETVRLSEFPWMALLKYDVDESQRSFLCSGTLITDRYVMTAAHCVNGENEVISVRLGEHDLKNYQDCEKRYSKAYVTDEYCAQPYIDVGVERSIKHAEYSASNMTSDIALIRLAYNIPFQTHIQPICLPRAGYVAATLPEMFVIAGWGTTERGYASDVLMKSVVPLRTNDVCEKCFSRSLRMRRNYLCAGGSERRATCRGDSGGPLFVQTYYGENVRYVQYGIISSGGNSCGSRDNLPGVYTNVAAYLPWILSQIQP